MAKNQTTNKPQQAVTSSKAGRKPGSTVPANETKADRFTRLAVARVSKAIKAIQNIGNLGGPNYEKTQEQVEKISEALQVACMDSVAKLSVTKVKDTKTAFSFE